MPVRPAAQLLMRQISRRSEFRYIRGLVEARHVTGDQTEGRVNFKAVGWRHCPPLPVARYRIIASGDRMSLR